MENNENKTLRKDHKVVIDNRKKMTLTGINKAISSGPNQIVLASAGSKIVISGKDLQLTKIDIVGGLAEIEGEINALKYLVSHTPQGFFKRVFS